MSPVGILGSSGGGGGGGERRSSGGGSSSSVGGSTSRLAEDTLAYTVKSSDTLTSLAARFDTTPSELVAINKLSSRLIFPGQVTRALNYWHPLSVAQSLPISPYHFSLSLVPVLVLRPAETRASCQASPMRHSRRSESISQREIDLSILLLFPADGPSTERGFTTVRPPSPDSAISWHSFFLLSRAHLLSPLSLMNPLAERRLAAALEQLRIHCFAV